MASHVKRRPERCISFTNETLATITPTKGHMDIFYDNDHPCLVARRPLKPDGSASPVRFYANLTGAQSKAAKMFGARLIRLNPLGNIPLEEARLKASAIYNEAQDFLKRKKELGRAGVQRVKKNVPPEDILSQKTAVDNPNYDRLQEVLMDAYSQAANGKGAERHSNGLDFEDQDMMQVMDRVGMGFALGQAIKKATEAHRIGTKYKTQRDRVRAELLGAIVYLAGAIIWVDQKKE